MILLATLTSLHLDPSLSDASERLARALHPRLMARDVVDAVRNIALFAGLGVLWIATMPRPRVHDVVVVTAFGALISFSVECAQLFSPIRTASLIDVMTNTIGACVGAGSMLLAMRVTAALSSRPRLLDVPLVGIAIAYVGASLAEIVTPLFRQEHIPDILGSRLHIALSTMPPFSLAHAPWLDFVLFIPAGVLITAFVLEEHGWERRAAARLWGLVAGVLIAALAELAHGAVGGVIRSDVAMVHALSFALGALVGPIAVDAFIAIRDLRRRLAIFLFSYSALLAIWAWRPFRPRFDRWWVSAQFGESHLVPLAALASRVDLFSVGHLASIFLLYVPLGAVLALRPPLRLRDPERGTAVGLRFGLLLVGVLELGHVGLADRTFDVTNAMVQSAGMWIGWLLTKRSDAASSPSAARPRSMFFAVSER